MLERSMLNVSFHQVKLLTIYNAQTTYAIYVGQNL